MRGILVAGFIAIVGLIFAAFDSFEIIDPGERGVIVTMGEVVGIAEPGVLVKTPFFTTVHKVSARDHVANFQGLQAYTRDQQTATVSNVSVIYRVDPAKVTEVYLQYGSADRMVEQLLTRPVGAYLETVFGQYNAERAVQERGTLNSEFANQIKSSVEGTPLIVASVNIEPFDLPDDYEANINDRMKAEVEARKAAEVAKTTVIDAQAAADAKLATATADAEAIRLRGEAEAAAIRARSEALKESPNLVALTLAERWDGILPTTMVPGDSVPFIDVNPAAARGVN